MTKANRPHDGHLVSVIISTSPWPMRHVLRDGPRAGIGAKTLCGRSAERIVDDATYCCAHSWRLKGWGCQVCSDVLWSLHD